MLWERRTYYVAVGFAHYHYSVGITWGEALLHETSGNGNARIELLPDHVFVAHPLLNIGRYLKRDLKAVICWQIWKDRNGHYLAVKPASAHRIIRESWHRISIYICKKWRFLVTRVHQGKVNFTEAEQLMHSYTFWI